MDKELKELKEQLKKAVDNNDGYLCAYYGIQISFINRCKMQSDYYNTVRKYEIDKIKPAY